MALQLIAIIHGSNVSALGLCEAFLGEMAQLNKLMISTGFLPNKNNVVCQMMDTLSTLHQPRPGSVARALKPIITSASLPQIWDLEQFLNQVDASKFNEISMTKAQIFEPQDNTDIKHKFIAGLVLALPLAACLENIHDVELVRIKIAFPDQSTQLVQPKLDEFRKVIKPKGKHNEHLGTHSHDYRLNTQICISSHGVWSEASIITISLLLDFRDVQSTALATNQAYSSLLTKASGIKSNKSEDNLVIEICKPVRVSIHPIKPRKIAV